jgi:hypothetical protein
VSLEETVGYLNMELSGRTRGTRPLHYVDVDSPELKDYPALAKAVGERRALPLVLVGSDVVSPGTLSYYWVVDQLENLGAPGFETERGGKG